MHHCVLGKDPHIVHCPTHGHIYIYLPERTVAAIFLTSLFLRQVLFIDIPYCNEGDEKGNEPEYTYTIHNEQ